MSMKWEPPFDGASNQIIQGKGFYLSYNPSAGKRLFEEALAAIVSVISGEEYGSGVGETALHVDEYDEYLGGSCWFILNGDFRDEYAAAFPGGLPAVLAVYAKHKAASRSNWSTD